MMINYNNKKFRPIETSENGETSEETIFVYRQIGNILTSEYRGGDIVEGHLLGVVDDEGNIDMRYHQINLDGKLMTGICRSRPELQPDGKLRIYEDWQWTSEDHSSGKSVLEEI